LRTDILNYLLNPAQRGKCEFVMEVTDKTRADVKVGLLKKYLLVVRCVHFLYKFLLSLFLCIFAYRAFTPCVGHYLFNALTLLVG